MHVTLLISSVRVKTRPCGRWMRAEYPSSFPQRKKGKECLKPEQNMCKLNFVICILTRNTTHWISQYLFYCGVVPGLGGYFGRQYCFKQSTYWIVQNVSLKKKKTQRKDGATPCLVCLNVQARSTLYWIWATFIDPGPTESEKWLSTQRKPRPRTTFGLFRVLCANLTQF